MGQQATRQSYAWCERLARQAAGNFYHAFRLLPPEKRRAMCALYAFFRITDDLSDGPGSVEDKRLPLRDWREALRASLQGEYRHPLYPALHDTVRRFGVPVRHLEEVIDGVCMDLDVSCYASFDELYRYCYLVASAVGLSCIHVWGFRGSAEKPAEAAGIALQLTNILRDVGEDAARGRIYLPSEDLAQFGYSTESLQAGRCDEAFRALMRFEADRAYAFYEQARPLAGLLSGQGRAVFQVILQTYRALLDAIVARDFDVFSSRVHLGRWHKVWLALRAGLLPGVWGGV